MSKRTSKKSPKSYKSFLSKLYLMIIVIISGAGAAFYITQLNDTLQSIYQSDNSSNMNIVTLQDINPSITKSIGALTESKDSTTPTFPTNTRINPFN